MSKWFFINLIVLLILIWKVLSGHHALHILIGGLGFLLFLMNWTRHAVFSTLRSNLERRKKIAFAKLSKKIYPFHKWVGTSALVILLIHAILAIQRFGFQLNHMKMLSGLMALFILACVVTTGWMRLYRPSKKKRLAHLWLGLSLFSFSLIHLLF